MTVRLSGYRSKRGEDRLPLGVGEDSGEGRVLSKVGGLRTRGAEHVEDGFDGTGKELLPLPELNGGTTTRMSGHHDTQVPAGGPEVAVGVLGDPAGDGPMQPQAASLVPGQLWGMSR